MTALTTPLLKFEVGPAIINDDEIITENMKQTKNITLTTSFRKSIDLKNTDNSNNNNIDKVGKPLDSVDPLLVKSLPVLKIPTSNTNMVNLSGNRLLLKPVHNIKASAITTYNKLSNHGRLYKSTTALEPIKTNFWS